MNRNYIPHHESAMIRQLQDDREIDPAAFFVPNGAQKRVLDACGEWNWVDTPIRTVLCGFANGVGKTAVCAAIVNAIVHGPANRWFDYPIFRNWPFSKQLRLIGTGANIRTSGAVDAELKKWLRKDYTTNKLGQDYTSLYQFKNGFSLRVYSNNQEAKEMEGPTAGFIWIDEPCTEEQYMASITRLRDKGGLILFAATLVTDSSFWVDETIINREDKKSIITLFASDEENCKQHGTRGLRDHREIELMRQHLESDPDTMMVRTGQKMSLVQVGRMFREFRPNIRDGIHVQPESLLPDLRGCTLYHTVDPHTDRPWAMAWFAVDENENYWVFDEWPNRSNTKVPYHRMGSVTYGMDHYKFAIEAVETRNKITNRINERFIDGRYAATPQLGDTEKRPLVDILAQEYGMYFTLSNMHPSSRVKAQAVVHDLLAYDLNKFRAGDTATQYAPRMYILENCRNIITAIQNHGYKKVVDARARSWRWQNESPKFKDFIDVLFIGVETLPGFRGGYRTRKDLYTTSDQATMATGPLKM